MLILIRTWLGSAGRPAFDKKGEALLVALSEPELNKYEERYFQSEGDVLLSGLRALMIRSPAARAGVQSQILSLGSKEGGSLKGLQKYARRTWYWMNANAIDRSDFESYVEKEVEKLQLYGFLSLSADNTFSATRIGKAANNTVFSPLSVRNLIGKAKCVISSKMTGKEFDQLVLSLVAIPFEMAGNDDRVRLVSIEKDTEFIDLVMVPEKEIREKYQRTNLCRHFATILWNWVNSLPTEEILSRCGLDPSSDAALLEEMLPHDASWVLSSVASLPDEAVMMTPQQRKRIGELADFCRIGSSDPIVSALLGTKASHMGRNTAITLARYMREKNKQMEHIKKEEFLELFKENRVAAEMLYKELETARL